MSGASAFQPSATSTNDTSAGTDARNVVVYGVDANRQAQTVVVTMNGTAPVVTSETWLGVNRIAIGSAGSGLVNTGTITATATTDLTTQGQVPAGVGTSQQCIFFIQAGHQALINSLRINVIREGGGAEPVVTIKGWVYSAISGSKYEVLRETVDANVVVSADLDLKLPFPIGASSAFWLEAESDRVNTEVQARFSLIEHRDVDG